MVVFGAALFAGLFARGRRLGRGATAAGGLGLALAGLDQHLLEGLGGLAVVYIGEGVRCRLRQVVVFPIELPPLRERRGDVPLLAEEFLERAPQGGSAPLRLTPEARAALDLPAGAKLILFFGFIKPYKGVVHLIDAADVSISSRVGTWFPDGPGILPPE